MLAHLSGDPVATVLDKLIDQIVNVRAAEVLDRRFGPTGQGVAPQHPIDVSPGPDVRDDLNLHKPREHRLERVDGPDQVTLAPFDPQIATFGRSLDDVPRLAARIGQLKGWGAAQGDAVLLTCKQAACGAGTTLADDAIDHAERLHVARGD